jgi:hypothetical protein
LPLHILENIVLYSCSFQTLYFCWCICVSFLHTLSKYQQTLCKERALAVFKDSKSFVTVTAFWVLVHNYTSRQQCTYKHNIEVLLQNHGCSGKAIGIISFECVSVTLVM